MLTIRIATAEDVPVLYRMERALAAALGMLDELCVDVDSLLADGFGEHPRFHSWMAEWNGRPAGMALGFFTYSTTTSRTGFYLEDLYVDPLYRRRGVARCLMAHLAQVVLASGCDRFQWLVLHPNLAARNFYLAIGAEAAEDWFPMRLTGAALRRVAG